MPARNYTDPNAQNITDEVRDGHRRIIATYLRARDLGRAVPLATIVAALPALADAQLLLELRAECQF